MIKIMKYLFGVPSLPILHNPPHKEYFEQTVVHPGGKQATVHNNLNFGLAL